MKTDGGAAVTGGAVVTAVVVPIRTVSAANAREHYRARMRRVKAERTAVALILRPALRAQGARPAAGLADLLPCTVTVTRVSPGRQLDRHDNLPMALKSVVDQIASELWIDDADDAVTWHYAQRKGPWAVEIAITGGAR